ncbi:MAG TPA: formate dehydrogenase subunit delta [Xanthobacteraceae bacterium]|nr:formate dehydrogenase subunit delta [Xanthobacteraceae bacterium]
MLPDKLVYMANQIGTFFRSQGEDRAPAAIAEHIAKFWDPRMQQAIHAHIAKDEAASGLDPLVLQAIKSLPPVQ